MIWFGCSERITERILSDLRNQINRDYDKLLPTFNRKRYIKFTVTNSPFGRSDAQ